MPPSARRIQRDRAEEIAELAEAVADEHCPAERVEPATIAEAKGVTVSFGSYGDAFDGLLEHRAGRFHVYVNLDRLHDPQSPRARFTLAHELGHYYLDAHRQALAAARAAPHGSQCEYESPILAEQEADHFAANLLMPRARFAARAKAAEPGLAGVLRLADRFGTSITSTAIRCAQADAAACAVVKWTWRGYAWKCLSSSTFRARLRRTYESADELAEDSPTRRALGGQAPPAGGYFTAATTAAAWFPRVEPGAWRDVLLIEQAVSLGRYGVLTFLYPEGGRYRLGQTWGP